MHAILQAVWIHALQVPVLILNFGIARIFVPKMAVVCHPNVKNLAAQNSQNPHRFPPRLLRIPLPLHAQTEALGPSIHLLAEISVPQLVLSFQDFAQHRAMPMETHLQERLPAFKFVTLVPTRCPKVALKRAALGKQKHPHPLPRVRQTMVAHVPSLIPYLPSAKVPPPLLRAILSRLQSVDQQFPCQPNALRVAARAEKEKVRADTTTVVEKAKERARAATTTVITTTATAAAAVVQAAVRVNEEKEVTTGTINKKGMKN